mmetsp:Transcript_11367/g.13007  ORF Transcript_11367/g.13007 Transcript_11367/m.13007 type:complete len:151 (-) Transcript_11367:69-521(-)
MTDPNEEQIADFKEAFSLFDKDGDSRIKTSELGLLIRSLNQNPTEAEIQKYIKEIDPDDTEMFSFPDFVALMSRIMTNLDPEEELIEAFRILDKNNHGSIKPSALKHLLCNYSERFTEEEADDMVKRAIVDESGDILYEEYAKFLISKYT